jgi:hypothetical protein
LEESDSRDKKIVQLWLNEELIGLSTLDSVSSALREFKCSNIVIHSLLNFDFDALLRFVLILRRKSRVFMWIHDVSYFCDSRVLVRNGSFCGLQRLGSDFCESCRFEGTRQLLFKFYEALAPLLETLLFPSVESKRRFLDYFGQDLMSPSKMRVVHNLVVNFGHKKKVDLRDHAKSGATGNENIAPVGIAFFGHSVEHKGWNLFANLVDQFSRERKFRFFHVGQQTLSHPQVVNVPFRDTVQGGAVEGLRDLCSKHHIKVGFFWSLTYESFGLMMRQVLAANCAVLARGDDPVLREAISGSAHVRYFDTFGALGKFVSSSEDLLSLTREAGTNVIELVESNGSFDVIGE